VANYFSWKRDQGKLKDSGTAVVCQGQGRGTGRPGDTGASEARIYMTSDEYTQKWLEYVQSLGYKTIEEWRQAKKEADGQ
jgi:hypothetical protein